MKCLPFSTIDDGRFPDSTRWQYSVPEPQSPEAVFSKGRNSDCQAFDSQSNCPASTLRGTGTRENSG